MPKFIDITGKRFGHWVVEKYLGPCTGSSLYRCRCDCGTIADLSSSNLRRGFSLSCGCIGNEANDLAGQRFGRLTVLGKAQRPSGLSNRSAYWLCQCDCGDRLAINGNSLRRGRSTSCGCYHQEAVTRHGLYKDPLQKVWSGMMQRCYNPKASRYERYGGRGITVCERWHDFANFHADVSPRPQGKTLDRIDNDGPYSPDNFRWSTPKQQASTRHRRTKG